MASIVYYNEACKPVVILSGVFSIIFDTGVIAVTIQSTLTILRVQEGVNALQKQTLTSLLIQQGMHFILCIGESIAEMQTRLYQIRVSISLLLLSSMHLAVVQICAYGHYHWYRYI